MIEDLGEGGEDGMEDSIARIMGLDKQRATPEDAEIITAQAQARRNLEERQQQLGAGDYVADVAMAVPRGVVGAAQGVYNLADILTFDILPDWDKNPLGGSATTVGGIVETIAEFGVGFLTGSAAISAASKIGKLGKVAKAAKWMQGPGKLQTFSKAATAGAIADFSVFEGDSMRLSNLIESIPGLSNPITEFLSAKEGDVDSLANRLKNVIEGGVVGSAVEGVIRGINGAYRMARGIAAAADVVRETRLAVEANKPLDEVFAVREAAMERNRKWIEDVPAASEEYVAAAERRFVEQDGAAQVLREQQPGSEKMIQRILLDSARKAEGGGLPRTAARAIESFIDRVGSLLFDGTTFSVRKLGEGHAGKYEFASDIITIARKVYEDAVDADKTFLHEAWHMLSRYLDDPVVRRLKTDYDKSVEAFRKKAGFDPRSMYAGDGNVDKLAKASKDAGADFFEAYAMTNMDEWFVYNMVKQTEKTMAREARTGAFGAVRNVIDSLVDSFRADGEMSKIADKFLSGGMENKAHRNLMTSYRRRLRERTASPTSADDLKVRSRREVDAGMASEDSVDMIRPVPTNADGTPNVSQLEADLKGTDAVAYSDKTPPTMTQAEQRLDPRVAAVRGSLEQLESLDEVAGLAAKDIDVAGLALDDELRRRMWVASEEVIRISRLPAYADQEIDIASALELLTERGQAYRESGTPVARRLQARDVYKGQYEEQLNAVSGGGTLPPDPPLLPNQPAATQPPPASPAAPTASAAPTTPSTPAAPAAPAAAAQPATPAAPAAAAQPATPAAPAAAAQPATPAAPAAAAQPATPAAGGTGTSAATGGTGTGAGTGRARAAARRSRIKQTQMVNVGGRLVPLSYIRAAINQRGGQRLLSLIISAATMTPHVPVSKFSRFMRTGLDMFTEMFKASILSGPRTLSTNHSGSMIAALVTQTERAIGTRIAARHLGGRVSRVLAQREGRVLMGHMNLATDTVRLLSFGAMDLPASVRNTFRQGGAPTLIPDSIISEASPGAFSPARTGLRTVKRDAQGNAMFDDLGRFEYEATGLGAALDWIGKVVGLPFRLMGTSDEMTKFRVIRENLTGILTDDVVKRNPGATADQIQQLVEAEFDKMLVDQKRLYSLAAVQEKAMRQAASEGLVQTQQAFKARVKKLVEQGDASIQFEPFDPDRAVLADMAAKRARQSTFQDDYDAIIHDPIAGLGAPLVGRIGKAAAGIVREFPAASLVLPFIKTPTNIIAFALNRNPASQVWNLLRKQIVARDPVLRAEAIGRLTTGAALYTTAVGLAAGGLITGRGPKDKEMRRQLAATGWQPYSVRVGDSYVSFQRAEPFSMMMGLVADAVDYLNNTYEESDEDGISMSIGTAVLAALTNNLTNKTFLVGITTALNAAMNPELHGPRLLRNYAGAVVPNLLTQFGPTTGDEELIEARTLLDAAMARLPWFGEAPESLDRVRNALGEPVERTASPYLDFLNPYVVSSRKRDPVMEEMVGLRKGFGQPRRVILGGIDLADYRNSRGQTAYDRFQEITSEIRVDGRTLRRSLMDLIKDPRFSSLPSGEVDGVDSPRVRMIRSRIDSYRKEAFDRLLREYPDLARRYQEALSTRSMMEN